MTADIKLSENTKEVQIIGEINIGNVAELRQKGIKLLQQISNPVIDLKQVTACDSATLALLTAWARDAKKSSKSIQFVGVPKKLWEIAQLSRLDQVLAIQQ